jgi:hypothetical protein
MMHYRPKWLCIGCLWNWVKLRWALRQVDRHIAKYGLQGVPAEDALRFLDEDKP